MALSTSFYVIGQCRYFGLQNTDNNVLINFSDHHKDKHITQIYHGYSFSIFSDEQHSNFWFVGNDGYGQFAQHTQHGHSDEYLPNDSSIEQLTKIEYFDSHFIQIKRVFVSLNGERIFWLTHDNLLYANGESIGCEPRLSVIPTSPAQRILDIQCGQKGAIAICTSHDTATLSLLVEFWSRSVQLIPNEIVLLIVSFSHSTQVYATHNIGNEDDEDEEDGGEAALQWKAIETFRDVSIVKVSSGRYFAVFLDSNGKVWSCGEDEYGCLGLGEHKETEDTNLYDKNEEQQTPKQIEWFVKNDVFITDVAAGIYHCIALDVNGRVYAWGCNEYNQCGVDSDVFGRVLHEPVLLNELEEYEVDMIKVGCWHSYCRTVDGKHVLFGDNMANVCLANNSQQAHLLQFIDDTHRVQNARIQSVYLGHECTSLLMQQEASK